MRTVTAALPCAALALALLPSVVNADDGDGVARVIARFDAGAELEVNDLPEG